MMNTMQLSKKSAKIFRRLVACLLLCVLFVGSFPTEALAASNVKYQYKVVKVKNLSKELSKTAFASTSGTPGVTVSINKTDSVSNTFSCTVGVKKKDINAALGWSESKTVSISNGGSWKVPAKANKKKVATGTLSAYVYMDRVEYKIIRRTVTKVSRAHSGSAYCRYGKWEDYKTGCIAYRARPNDICFKTTYTYKK